ncbi:hypothetical protein JCM10369A_31880 [Nocardioides pyridinolyticus]
MCPTLRATAPTPWATASQTAAAPWNSAVNRRATGPGPLRTARGAGRRVVFRGAGLRFAVLRELVEAGLRWGLVLRDRVLELRDEELPVLRVVDVLLLRDPGGEDVRVAMVSTLRSSHSRHTYHRSACLGPRIARAHLWTARAYRPRVPLHVSQISRHPALGRTSLCDPSSRGSACYS